MSNHAEKCPVCGGEPIACHGCNGRGWVTVEDGPMIKIQWGPSEWTPPSIHFFPQVFEPTSVDPGTFNKHIYYYYCR